METPSSEVVSTRQQQIAKLAKQMPAVAISTLNHHVDMVWMEEAYRRTRKDGAVGIDGQTAGEYGRALESNLKGLIDRAKSGNYRAPPVKRAYIPKGANEWRPLGIPTFEDKVLQRAVAMVLEPVYEQEFLPCSYGYRPGRDAHGALEGLWKGIMDMGGCWVIDADLRKFFDTVDHREVQQILRKRVSDGVVCRLIGKWLNAGVMEDGSVSYPEAGTPQGGVISPMLSNIFLHEVLDQWFEQEVRPRMAGPAKLIRYADDFVLLCKEEADARRVLEVLPKRFARYKLSVHPEKTRLVDFRQPSEGTKGETFDFLGFRFYWGTSRKGRAVVRRKTASTRLSRALSRIGDWCRKNRHMPVEEQASTLGRKLKGHYNYYGLTGNMRSLRRFYSGVCRRWYKWLNRRSRLRNLSWADFCRQVKSLEVPTPVVVHSVYRARGEAAM